MKHQNPKGEDHRSEEAKERDPGAAQDEKALIRHKTTNVDIGGNGEPIDRGRNTGPASHETRRTER